MNNIEYIRFLAEKTACGEAFHDMAKSDPLRPIYHPVPPSGWMNDPNGLSMYDNKYHLYYQYNPDSPVWGNICWGHMESDDLVYWRHRPVAIAPSEEYDRDGIHSGTAVEYRGRFLVYYTGHRYLSGGYDPLNEDMLQVQCLAEGTPDKLVKADGNPLIERAPGLASNHFRDPKVWADKDGLRMILGGTDGVDSHLPLFVSSDGLHWEYQNDIAYGVNGSMGRMWECPDLFALDGCTILMGCPMHLDFPWPASRACYFIGSLQNNDMNFVPQTQLQAFDLGDNFYAPQTVADKMGRRVMFGWIMTPDSPKERLWSGCQSLPRLLYVKESKLFSVPLPELEKLRCSRESEIVENIAFSGTLFPNAGMHCEYDSDIMLMPDAIAELALRELRLRFSYENETSVIVTAEQHNINRSWRISAPKGHLRFRLFVDGAVCEMFFADGEVCFSTCLWQDSGSFIDMRTCSGKAYIIRSQVWRLKDIGL